MQREMQAHNSSGSQSMMTRSVKSQLHAHNSRSILLYVY